MLHFVLYFRPRPRLSVGGRNKKTQHNSGDCDEKTGGETVHGWTDDVQLRMNPQKRNFLPIYFSAAGGRRMRLPDFFPFAVPSSLNHLKSRRGRPSSCGLSKSLSFDPLCLYLRPAPVFFVKKAGHVSFQRQIGPLFRSSGGIERTNSTRVLVLLCVCVCVCHVLFYIYVMP